MLSGRSSCSTKNMEREPIPCAHLCWVKHAARHYESVFFLFLVKLTSRINGRSKCVCHSPLFALLSGLPMRCARKITLVAPLSASPTCKQTRVRRLTLPPSHLLTYLHSTALEFLETRGSQGANPGFTQHVSLSCRWVARSGSYSRSHVSARWDRVSWTHTQVDWAEKCAREYFGRRVGYRTAVPACLRFCAPWPVERDGGSQHVLPTYLLTCLGCWRVHIDNREL